MYYIYILSATKARGKKRKRIPENEEKDYEQQPRSFATEENSEMRMLLPIIDKGRVIKQMTERGDALEKEGWFCFFNNIQNCNNLS